VNENFVFTLVNEGAYLTSNIKP